MFPLAITIGALGLLVILIMAVINITKTENSVAGARRKPKGPPSLVRSYSSQSFDDTSFNRDGTSSYRNGTSTYRDGSVSSSKTYSMVGDHKSMTKVSRPTSLASGSVYPPTVFDRCIQCVAEFCPCARQINGNSPSSTSLKDDPEYGIIVEKLYLYKTPGRQKVFTPSTELKPKTTVSFYCKNENSGKSVATARSKLSEFSISAYVYTGQNALSLTETQSWSNVTEDIPSNNTSPEPKLSIVSHKSQTASQIYPDEASVKLPTKQSLKDVNPNSKPEDTTMPIVLLFDASSSFETPKSNISNAKSSPDDDAVLFSDTLKNGSKLNMLLSDQVNPTVKSSASRDSRRSKKKPRRQSSKPKNTNPPPLNALASVHTYTESVRQFQLPLTFPDVGEEDIDDIPSSVIDECFQAPVVTNDSCIQTNDKLETLKLHRGDSKDLNAQAIILTTHEKDEFDNTDYSPSSSPRRRSNPKQKIPRIKGHSGRSESRDTTPELEYRSEIKSKCATAEKDSRRRRHSSSHRNRSQLTEPELSPSTSSFYAIIPSPSPARANMSEADSHCFRAENIIFENSLFNVRVASNENRVVTTEVSGQNIVLSPRMLDDDKQNKGHGEDESICLQSSPSEISEDELFPEQHVVGGIKNAGRDEYHCIHHCSETRHIIEDDTLDVRLGQTFTADIAPSANVEDTNRLSRSQQKDIHPSSRSDSDDDVNELQSNSELNTENLPKYDFPVVSVRDYNSELMESSPSSKEASPGATLRWQIVLKHGVNKVILEPGQSRTVASSSEDEERPSDDNNYK